MPYIVGHPVQNPSDFYGREQQVSRLFKVIGGPQAQSIPIIGLNRAGKTSFFQYIAHPTVMVRYLRHPEKVAMIYIDMVTCKTPAHFYFKLRAQLRKNISQVNTGFLWKNSHPDQMNIHDVEACLCHYQNQRIILLLDGFDQINMEAFGRHFLTELQAMTSVLDYDLICVVAAEVDLLLFGNRIGLPLGSPFYNIFFPVPIYLGELDTAVIDSLICQPAIQAGNPFSAAELHQIKQLAGTLPFLAQTVAARWLYLKQQLADVDTDVLLNQLVAELEPTFARWLASFDQCQQQILSQLAQHKPLSQLPFSEFTLIEAEKKLGSLGLLVNNGRQTIVNGKLLGTWLNQKTNQPPGEPSLHLKQQDAGVSASVV